LLIFAPAIVTRPLCSQYPANWSPAAVDWARSFSWEDQVDAAAVDVEGGPEVSGRHRRALQVPARPAGAPGGPPGRLARLRALPQGEITGVSLDRRRGPVLGVGVLGRAHVGQSLSGQRAVPGRGVHVEVHVAAGLVRMASVDQPLDQRDHVRDVARGAGFRVGRPAAEQRVGVGKGARVPLGQRPPGSALGGGGAQDLVIDVGDVPAVGHREPGGLQPAHQEVKADRRAEMP
jgi:hypothetical protein